MSESLESRKLPEVEEDILEERRMDEFRMFFSSHLKKHSSEAVLDAVFDIKYYAATIHAMWVNSQGFSFKGMTKEEVESFAEELKARCTQALAWFVENGFLEQVGEDAFRLTEKGKEIVRPN